MGTRIYLIADGAQISPEAWNEVYFESLRLLGCFPAPLMRFQVQRSDQWKRYVYTPQLVTDKGLHTESWRVCGDMTSRQDCEEFVLFRNHGEQFATRLVGDAKGPRDVLWAEPGNESARACSGSSIVWDFKTQGYPYHYAMLAVGMLIEGRFPHAAYVIGDITRRDAEHAAAWAAELLGESLEVPVCVDADRLCTRLLDLYEDGLPALRRFMTLFRGTEREEWRTIARHAEAALRRRFLTTRLEEWDSLGQAGAAAEIGSYLEATGDVSGLIESVQSITNTGHKNDREFSTEALLKELCERKVTLTPQQRQADRDDPAKRLTEADPELASMLANLFNAVPQTEFYIPPDELLKVFAQAHPEQRERFAEIIAEYDKAPEADGAAPADKLRSKTARRDTHKQRRPPVGTRYIELTVVEHTLRGNPEEQLDLVRITARELRDRFVLSPPLSKINDSALLLHALIDATVASEIVLTEPAWHALDSLENPTILKYLIGLASIKNNGLAFCDLRRYLFEHPDLWSVFLEEPT